MMARCYVNNITSFQDFRIPIHLQFDLSDLVVQLSKVSVIQKIGKTELTIELYTILSISS